MPRQPRKKKRGATARQQRRAERAQEISVAVPITYIVCPLCHRNRPLVLTSEKSREKGKLGPVQWNTWDPETSPIIQVREGGGYASGFHTIAELTWGEAASRLQFIEHIDAIKEQIARIKGLR